MFPSSPGQRNNLVVERALIGIGAILVIVAPYMPWVRVVILGSFNLTGLLSAAHSFVGVAYLISALGLAVLLVAVLARSVPLVRGLSISVGATLLLAGGYVVYGLVRAVSDSAGLGQLEVGPIVGVIGSILMTVPPLVGSIQESNATYMAKQHRWQNAQWLPAIGAIAIGSAIAWIPYHAGVNNYCGSAVGVEAKQPIRLPSANPPASVASVLSQDQAAVAAAQIVVDQESQTNASASQKQSAADALSNQANQAADQVSTLEGTVNEDGGTVQGDEGTVQGDQSTVQSDENEINLDQSTLQADQQFLTSDQQSGYSTAIDEQSVANDNQTLSNDQASLSKVSRPFRMTKVRLTEMNRQ